MVELVGDHCAPSSLVVPELELIPTGSNISGGFLFLSGGKLLFDNGAGAFETITSA